MKKLIPTQIYFPEKLRSEIDKLRKENDESLGEYIRKAIRERLIKVGKQI